MMTKDSGAEWSHLSALNNSIAVATMEELISAGAWCSIGCWWSRRTPRAYQLPAGSFGSGGGLWGLSWL